MNKSNNKGFSLVELIVVIAIMAILVGAIAPQVIKYIDSSKQSKDKSNLSTIYSAVNTAIADTASTSSEAISEASTAVALDSYGGSTFQENLEGILGTLSNVKMSNGNVPTVKVVKETSGKYTVEVFGAGFKCDQNGCVEDSTASS